VKHYAGDVTYEVDGFCEKNNSQTSFGLRWSLTHRTLRDPHQPLTVSLGLSTTCLSHQNAAAHGQSSRRSARC
jgi:hypothetical protein